MKNVQKLKATVSLRLEESEKEKFNQICNKLKSTKSEVSRDLLRNFINKLNILS